MNKIELQLYRPYVVEPALLEQYVPFARASTRPIDLVSANVATVPHYSPFRYPGGKTWLTHILRRWFAAKPVTTICEPFAGGASASLIAIVEGYVERAILVEKDASVASVWRTILSSNAERLIERILRFKISRRTVNEVLNSRPTGDTSLAFQTIVKNRCRHGGILAGSAGLLIRGERDRGLFSRWYPETLAKRIRLIHSHRERIAFVEGDGISALQRFGQRKQQLKLFVDPPYPKLMQPGVRPLYNHCALNHERIFRLLEKTPHDFLLTYDDTDYARRLARTANFCYLTIAMRNSNADSKKELIITPSPIATLLD